MGSLSIQKGKRAERQVASLLNPIVVEVCASLGVEPFKLLRNLKQVQDGGYDLEGLDWIAIEVKHHKQVSLGAWWAQCCRQAGSLPTGGYMREPVLIWKQHGGKWNVRMEVRLLVARGGEGRASRWIRSYADIPMEAFLIWFRARLIAEIEAGEATQKIET